MLAFTSFTVDAFGTVYLWDCIFLSRVVWLSITTAMYGCRELSRFRDPEWGGPFFKGSRKQLSLTVIDT